MEITRIIAVADYIKQRFRNLHATGTYVSGDTFDHFEYVCKTPLEVIKEKFQKLCDVIIMEDTSNLLQLRLKYNENTNFVIYVWRTRTPEEFFFTVFMRSLDRHQKAYVCSQATACGYRIHDKGLIKCDGGADVVEPITNKTALKRLLKIKNI